MKLFYYQGNNFGDKLNPIIWNSLASELFDDDESTVLIGIGTLINSNAPRLPRKIVFGSGVGYMEPATIDDTWKFYCVRGPLSAQALRLPEGSAITDPAILLKQLIIEPVIATNEICFMPHHVSAQYADWREICKKANITYLDPADDTHTLIRKIRGAKLVIAEAMHAAVVADAFRVPWVPVKCYDHILGFKWEDWCLSVGVPYEPITIPSVWDIDRTYSSSELLKIKVKRGLKDIGIWSGNWTPVLPATNLEKIEDSVVSRLTRLASGEHAYLSSDCKYMDNMSRLQEKLEKLLRDYGKQ